MTDARAALVERLKAAHDRWAYMDGPYGPDAAHVQTLTDTLNFLAALADAPVPPATPRPDTHNHEQGAPLVDDCDTWCRGKFERWQKSATVPPATEEETAHYDPYGDFTATLRDAATVAGWDGLSNLDDWIVARLSALAAPVPALPPCPSCVSEFGKADPACEFCGGSGVCPSATAAPVPALREQEELAEALVLWADQLASEGRDGPYQVMRKAAKLLRVQSFTPEGT